MHIMEGFLPPLHCIGWGLVSAPFVAHGAVKVIKIMREQPQMKLTLAASGAFTFVLSAMKMPSVTGSCSHPTGTGLGAVLFGPPVMAVLGTIVLLFQALLLFHDAVSVQLVVAAVLMAFGVYLHLTERHSHEHEHEPLEHEHRHVHDEHHQHAHGSGEPLAEPHTHRHTHAPMRHKHPHYPDMHHRHGHGG